MSSEPGPEDVAQALRGGTAPSVLVDDGPAPPKAPAAPGLCDDPVEAGGLVVHTVGGSLVDARRSALEHLQADGVARALVDKDPTLWGPEAAAEAGDRLGWLDAVSVGRALVPDLVALREELAGEGVDRVVLSGMCGSSLAPEVICAAAGCPLVVLDSTDPGQVAAALTELERTVVVCSSKSGRTVETDSHRRAARAAFVAAGLDPARRVVVVTDPGSPLAEAAEREGSRAVFLADPQVGVRYAALDAVGLVPAALAGVDVAALLDEAAALESSLADPDGPAMALGAVLGGAAVAGRDKLVLVDDGSGRLAGTGRLGGTARLADWVEQLVAGSTGKQGRGILPVVVEGPDAPGTEPAADVHLVRLGAEPASAGTGVTGPLGAQFLAWEFATAVAGRVLGVNPFDQPDVQESKDRTAGLLDAPDAPGLPPLVVTGAVEVRATGDLLAEVADLAGALEALLHAVPDRGYLAVMAYLDRQRDAAAAGLRAALARRLAHPVTFGWAPRLLHSAGQLHRGGPATGAYLQITGAVDRDLEVPDRPYTFGQLQAAQAAGDLSALTTRERPVLWLHLTDRAAGLEQILETALR